MLIILLMNGIPLICQNSTYKPVTIQADIDAFKAALTRETAKMSDMKADFTQTNKFTFLNEEVITTGTLYFASGKRLRWEYVTSNSFVFILNGAKVWMINQGGTTEMDVNANKTFKELSELMLFGIGGTSLFENRNFDFSFRTSGKQWEVALTPKTKEMKGLYSRIELTFSASSYQMESMRMIDNYRDETLIELSNLMINTCLSDALFEGKK